MIIRVAGEVVEHPAPSDAMRIAVAAAEGFEGRGVFLLTSDDVDEFERENSYGELFGVDEFESVMAAIRMDPEYRGLFMGCPVLRVPVSESMFVIVPEGH